MNKFRDTGNFIVTGTPWSHTARITEVPLYKMSVSISACLLVCDVHTCIVATTKVVPVHSAAHVCKLLYFSVENAENGSL